MGRAGEGGVGVFLTFVLEVGGVLRLGVKGVACMFQLMGDIGAWAGRGSV